LVARAARGYERWTEGTDAQIADALSLDLNSTPNLRQLVTTQQTYAIPDTRQYVGWRQNIAGAAHVRSWMGVPLVAGGRTVGLYSLDKTEPDFFTLEHQRWAEALAAQAATAIQNARLYRQAQRELTERQQAESAEREQRVWAEAMRDIVALLNSSLDLDTVFEGILDQVDRVVPSEAGSIVLIVDDMVEVTRLRGYDEAHVGWQFPLNRPHLLKVLRTGRPEVIDDAQEYDGWISTPGTAWVRSVITAAVYSGREVIGFLSLERDTPGAFAPQHVERLQVFANQAGIAVRNARLFEAEQRHLAEIEQAEAAASAANAKMRRELALAGAVQTSFLPRELPDLAGWQLAVTLRPAGETSGDFYDVHSLPDGRVGILIADVAGKGVGAALYMAASWALLRTYAGQAGTDPKRVLEATNRRITQEARTNRFATVFYALLDPTSGTLAYCNAGHCPALLYRAADPEVLHELPAQGMPLGMLSSATWETQSIQMAPGDALVIYTDGVIEARNKERDFFDEERLHAAILAHAERPASEIQTGILEVVDAFVGQSARSDDVALTVLVREPERAQTETAPVLRVAAELENLGRIRRFVAEQGAALGAAIDAVDDMILAVDECATNIMRHGYRGREGEIVVEVRRDEAALIACLRDMADPFDPRTVPQPDLSLPLEQRPLGKMGVFFVNQLVDRIEYAVRPGGGNELTLIIEAAIRGSAPST
jgi:serine phosphatase RsbU (regulator of sigma subunit)/anti-sigma regulatory factor (Ser/Thr protein kinase)/putative methionine-R-sulfoxide reductase with GAF domain